MKIQRVLGAALLGIVVLAAAAFPASAAAVKVTVNGTPITDVQIAQRLALHKIEGKNSSKAATEELINEAIQLQEAARLGVTPTEADVDSAVLDVARQIRVSVSNLTKILTDNGVPMSTLRDRLRANVGWARVTQTVVATRVQVSEADIDSQAKQKLTAANSFDYILKEVLFIMPGGKGSASKRTAEANQYRKNFAGCDSAVDLSLKYTDAAVRDVGRRHATQFPEALANELSKLNVGGITKPRVVESGVSMLAICEKTQAEDLTFIKGDLSAEQGNQALEGQVTDYLADLRSRAKIIYT